MKNYHPLDIIIFHVGGIGNYGPVDAIIKTFPQRSVVICFEANVSEGDYLMQEKYRKLGARTVMVPKCIGEKHGKHPFYVNKHPASSSIYPPAKQALEYHVQYKRINTWKENTELDRMSELDIVTLDELVRDGTVPLADVLSMDAQGSEIPVMQGGKLALQELLFVVWEVDFIELYQGQAVFADQDRYLTQQGFRIADILNQQYWHPGPAAGDGFLTVGEALYFRQLDWVLDHTADKKILPQKLIKLAMIAYAFRRISYSTKILSMAFDLFNQETKALLASDASLTPMVQKYQYLQAHKDDYLKDNMFFYPRSMRERLKRLIKRSKQAVKKVL